MLRDSFFIGEVTVVRCQSCGSFFVFGKGTHLKIGCCRYHTEPVYRDATPSQSPTWDFPSGEVWKFRSPAGRRIAALLREGKRLEALELAKVERIKR